MNVTWALVPIKSLDRAKHRLAPVLGDEPRRELVLAMAQDVLNTLEAVDSIERILLVSSETEAGALLHGRKLEVFYSTPGEGINRELEFSAAYARRQGADQALIVHSDLPLLDAASIEGFIGSSSACPVRAAACKNASGTNLLLAQLPLDFSLKFGRNSLQRFAGECADRQLAFESTEDDRLGMDIDSPEDFDALMALNIEGCVSGAETQSFLNDFARPLRQADVPAHCESNPPH